MDISKLKQFKIKCKLNLMFAVSGVLMIVTLITVYMIYTATHYSIDFYHVSNSHIKGNVRIVFVSDLHNHIVERLHFMAKDFCGEHDGRFAGEHDVFVSVEVLR